MPTAAAALRDAHGWGIRLTFRDHVMAELGAGDAAPVTAGERKDCDLVIPGVGERVTLTQGATLTVPAGLVGEVHVGERVLPAEVAAPLTLAPGDRATLRIAAYPEVTLELRRVEREQLPWTARFHGRDLLRQLITGSALVAMVALLWRVERVENVLKLRGDPLAEAEDSPLLRVMFAPTAEPLEVTRARELFAASLTPSPPPPAPPEEGVAAFNSAPTPIPLAAVSEVKVEEPIGELVESVDDPPPEARVRSKKVRRSKRVPEPEESALFAVLDSSDTGMLSLLASRDAPDDAIAGLIGVGGGGVAEGVLGGVEGGVLGGVEGGVVGGVLGSTASVGAIGTLGTGSTEHVVKDMVEGAQPAPAGIHSHTEHGAQAPRGELDGLAAAVSAASCPNPEVVRKRQIDVVFAVDVSTTMNFMLGKIGSEIAAVDAEVRAQGLDARYGLVVFVDDVLVTGGGQAFADIAALQQELAVWQKFTSSNRQIGSAASNLDWPENTLDALHAAAADFAWRPAATTLRAIVHATDDDFGEAPAVQSGQRVRHGYGETVAALRAAEVRVFSFAAKVGGSCECLDVKAGLMAPYRGQQAIPAATGGAVFDIDEVAAGTLNFGAAVSGALQTAVCTHYPLSPFAAPKTK
jgi:hypothetical protein